MFYALIGHFFFFMKFDINQKVDGQLYRNKINKLFRVLLQRRKEAITLFFNIFWMNRTQNKKFLLKKYKLGNSKD